MSRRAGAMRSMRPAAEVRVRGNSPTMIFVQREPAERAYELINGFRASQLVRLAVTLRLPDLLADGPLSAQDLSNTAGVDASRLRRVMRGLTGLGVFEESEDGRFRNTEVGEMLREDVKGTRRALAMMLMPESYLGWEHLMETVRTGKTGHEIAHGGTLWDHLARDPDFAARFNQDMAAASERVVDFVASDADFSSAKVIVDVGGGKGALAAGILEAHAHLRAIICDIPAGLAQTPGYLAARGVADRCTIAEADFFKAVPSGGDVYLLKDIIHDWDDEPAARILATCRRASAVGGRILLIERVLPERVTEAPADLSAVMTDLQMMVQLGSRERTAEEYRGLLEGAGFTFSGAVPGGLYGIVEAVAR